jgi:predicted dehydrogenase
MSQSGMTRRTFMRTTAGGTLASSFLLEPRQIAASPRPAPPSDTLRFAIIGCGMRGGGVLPTAIQLPGVECVAACELWDGRATLAREIVGKPITVTRHYEELLDRKDIDCIYAPVPDHWHSKIVMDCCKAGKDVYVEKPICCAVEEGKVMVDAARKHERVVQVGTQQRSAIHFQEAVKLVQQGYLGKVSFVRAWNYSNDYPKGIGNPPDSDPPAGLDWDAWLGPAPKRPFNANRFGVGDRWSTFRYFWDYAGGFMTDWGVHLMDIVQWAMQVDGPYAITAAGGKFFIEDNAETPDTLQVTYQYPHFVATYENRWDNANSMYNHGYGIEFHGTDATMFVDRGGFEVFPETRPGVPGAKHPDNRAPAMKMDACNNDHYDHIRNFLDCVKSRQRPISDIEIGHRSTSVCLLGNVAYRSQRRVMWDVAKQQVLVRNADAEQYLARHYRAPWVLTA